MHWILLDHLLQLLIPMQRERWREGLCPWFLGCAGSSTGLLRGFAASVPAGCGVGVVGVSSSSPVMNHSHGMP